MEIAKFKTECCFRDMLSARNTRALENKIFRFYITHRHITAVEINEEKQRAGERAKCVKKLNKILPTQHRGITRFRCAHQISLTSLYTRESSQK